VGWTPKIDTQMLARTGTLPAIDVVSLQAEEMLLRQQLDFYKRHRKGFEDPNLIIGQNN